MSITYAHANNKDQITVDETRLSEIVTLYDENLSYGDSLFGLLTNGLEDRQLMKTTVVVLLSDHGEAFLEHERVLHSSTVYDEMIHVPLIIRWPGLEGGGESSYPVQLCDVTRTLFDNLLGTKESDYLQGISLMPFLRPGASQE